MTRSTLIEKVSDRVDGLTLKQTEIVIDTVFENIKGALQKGEKVEIRGFGNFRLKDRKPRTARNPKTGETVEVAEKKAIRFKVGKALREALNPEQAEGAKEIADEQA